MRDTIYDDEGRARAELTQVLDEFGYQVSSWSLKDNAEGERTLAITAKRMPDEHQTALPLRGPGASESI